MGCWPMPTSAQHACPYPFYSETVPLPVPQIPNPLQGLLLNEIIALLVAPLQASMLWHKRNVWFEASTISNSQSVLEPKRRYLQT